MKHQLRASSSVEMLNKLPCEFVTSAKNVSTVQLSTKNPAAKHTTIAGYNYRVGLRLTSTFKTISIKDSACVAMGT